MTMVSEHGMAWWSFTLSNGKRRLATRLAAVLLVVGAGAVMPTASAAQAVSPSEREALVRLRVSQGGVAEEVDALLRHADAAASKGLPVTPLTNKIREGLAKGAAPNRIEAVVGRMALDLETADRLLRELQPRPTTGAADDDTPVRLLAEALGGGITPEEVDTLHRQARSPDQTPISADGLGSAAKGLSLIKEAGLPLTEGTAVMAEAVKQGFRPLEMLDLGRGIKRLERDYREGRESLLALRDAIARGEPVDRLFHDARPPIIERPDLARPDHPVTRPEPTDRPDRIDRPERTDRPDRPDSHPGRDRPERPDRPGGPLGH